MDFEKLDLDDVSVSIDEIAARAKQIEGGKDGPKENKGPKRKVWYPGLCDKPEIESVVRVLPFYNEREKKWEFDMMRTLHEHFYAGGSRTICESETFGPGNPCKICSLRIEYGKKYGWTDARFKAIKKDYNFNEKFQHESNILLVKDCGHPGDGDFKRGPYAPGEVLPMSLTKEPYKEFIAIIANPRYPGIYNPKTGRNLIVRTTINPSTKFRETKILPDADRSAIADSDDGIRAILKKCEDLSLRKTRVSKEEHEKIDFQIAKIHTEVEAKYSAKTIVQMPAGAGTDGMKPADPPSTPAPTPPQDPPAPSGDLVQMGKKPTPKINPATGKRFCYKVPGTFDKTNNECQMCPSEFECAATK